MDVAEQQKRVLYYTIKELASMLGVSERTARRYVATRGVRSERLGMGFIYWRHDLLDRCSSMMHSLGLLEDEGP